MTALLLRIEPVDAEALKSPTKGSPKPVRKWIGSQMRSLLPAKERLAKPPSWHDEYYSPDGATPKIVKDDASVKAGDQFRALSLLEGESTSTLGSSSSGNSSGEVSGESAVAFGMAA